MSTLTQKIAMGKVVQGSVWIRKGPANKALPTLVIPPRLFAGRDPADELRDHLSTLERGGYRILPWEDRQSRRGKPQGSAEADPTVPASPGRTFPTLYAWANCEGIDPAAGAGPEIAAALGEPIRLAPPEMGCSRTIEPEHGIATLFFALTEARAGRMRLADDDGRIVDPIRWLKASGLLEDQALRDAARRFGLLDAASLLQASAAESWF